MTDVEWNTPVGFILVYPCTIYVAAHLTKQQLGPNFYVFSYDTDQMHYMSLPCREMFILKCKNISRNSSFPNETCLWYVERLNM